MPMPDSTGVRSWVILDGRGPAAARRFGACTACRDEAIDTPERSR